MTHALTSKTFALALAAAAALAGCGLETDDTLVPPGEPTNAREKLERSSPLAELQPGAQIALTARVGADAEPIPVDVRIQEGYVVVSAEADGSLVLVDLDVAIEDVVLGEGGGPIEGLHLTGLRGRLAEPVVLETTWLDGDQEAFGTGPVSMLLDWSIQPETGDPTPLMTQRIDEIQLEIRVFATDGVDLGVEALGAREGVFWSWSRQIELSDLAIEASALEL